MIFVLALIVFGPKKLPELAKKLGSLLGNLRHAAENVKNEVTFQINLDEEKKALDDKYRQLEKETKKQGGEK
jgi:Tat protein translocase TatB subunit